jgi:hypothetical protein
MRVGLCFSTAMTSLRLLVCLVATCAVLGLTTQANADVGESPPASAPPPTAVGGQWQWKGAQPPEEKYSLMQRQLTLSRQIGDLERERAEYGIAGPIVMMAAGGGVALGALYFYAIFELVDGLDCQHSSSSNCSPRDTDQAKFVTATIGIGGVAVAIAGLVMLNNRIAPRRELGREINFKKSELRSIEQRLRFSTLLGPNNLRGVSLSLSF